VKAPVQIDLVSWRRLGNRGDLTVCTDRTAIATQREQRAREQAHKRQGDSLFLPQAREARCQGKEREREREREREGEGEREGEREREREREREDKRGEQRIH
jgi:hypothetical protein